MVLKETLLRNQLPAASVGIEFFRTLDRSGALLVADDVGNVVWRVAREKAGR